MRKRQIRGRVGPLSPAAAKAEALDGVPPQVAAGDNNVSVDVMCPGGHRLIRFLRNLPPAYNPADPEPDAVAWRQRTIGKGVRFDIELGEDGAWSVLWFDCKTCRDRGHPQVSTIAFFEVESRLAELHALGVPKRARVVTAPFGTSR